MGVVPVRGVVALDVPLRLGRGQYLPSGVCRGLAGRDVRAGGGEGDRLGPQIRDLGLEARDPLFQRALAVQVLVLPGGEVRQGQDVGDLREPAVGADGEVEHGEAGFGVRRGRVARGARQQHPGLVLGGLGHVLVPGGLCLLLVVEDRRRGGKDRAGGEGEAVPADARVVAHRRRRGHPGHGPGQGGVPRTVRLVVCHGT
ncbi:hypothetical protein ACIPLC_11510 [Kitasatospora sp. NPDC086801]|uniref:hypothetical protein n=1 Tax=Kitasatospora sp. NPDC086801 TaxID=3364066 RepID=UPI003830D28F